MANTFKNAPVTDIGTSPETVYTTPASTTTIVIGLSACNLTASPITIDVQAAGAHIRKSYQVAANAFASVLDGKIVLEAGDTLIVTSSAATSVDVLASLMEQT